MEYGININCIDKRVGIKTAAQMIARAGYTMVDYTPPVMQESWKADMNEALKIFDDCGLTVHQTHAPFNRYGACGDQHKLYLERSAEATALMGAKFMVVHGDEFDFEHDVFSPELALDYNHQYFLPSVESAKQNGYKVAFETVFDDCGRRRFTSRADELLDLITSFESENAVCCWDFGHSNITFGKEAPNLVRTFGKLIQCTHLHDNTGIDTHQMPMTGDIDWKATLDAFREIGYKGVMSVEYSRRFPEHVEESFISITLQIARYLWENK